MNTVGEKNPYLYRGYRYDAETGLYYLNSRYYDPEIGRFINADRYVSTGQGLSGNNMFVYCGNNPIRNADPSGKFFKSVGSAIHAAVGNLLKKIVNQVVQNTVTAVKFAIDIKNFDINNQSEEKALKSNYFSAYKGVPVFRINGNRSGSFGAIFLTRESNERDNPEDVVRHEYGHTRQLHRLGIVKYTIDIFIPSALDLGDGYYYDKPWEITADIYGGVQSRHHTEEDIAAGFLYLECSRLCGPFMWLFMN